MHALRKNWFCGELDSMAAGGQAFEFHGDEAVVTGSCRKNFASEFEACGERSFPVLFEFGDDAFVVCWIANDGNTFEVFAAERSIVGPPMSIFSMSSSAVRPSLAAVASKG